MNKFGMISPVRFIPDYRYEAGIDLMLFYMALINFIGR